MFSGHIEMHGGPHVVHGPDVAKAWSKIIMNLQLLRINDNH